MSNSGVDFNFSFAPGVLDEQILGFEVAGDIWSQYLKDVYQDDEIEINIYVAVGDGILPDDVVGGAFPAIESGIAYRDVYNALQDDSENEIEIATDKVAADSLLNLKDFPVLVGGEVVWNNPEIQATRANLKALDLLEGDPSELDGFIVMNSLANTDSVSWNYNYLEAPQEGEIDFLSVAMHEIGHNLGFISGVDTYGWNQQSADFDGTGIDNLTTLDLFRNSKKTFEIQDVSYSIMLNDLTFGQDAYFCIDRTAENAIAMSTGADYQGSHWSNGDIETGMGIMNPTVRLGERWEISETDLTAFDVIGWDVDYDADFDVEKLVEDAVEDLYSIVLADSVEDILDADGDLDLDVLFANSQFEIDYIREDLADEVDGIFSGQAYEWAWNSSSSSGSGYWWAWNSSSSSGSGYWWAWNSSSSSGSGYWSTYDTDASSSDKTDVLSSDTSATTSNYDLSSLEDIGEESISGNSVLDQNITTTQTKHKKHKWKIK